MSWDNKAEGPGVSAHWPPTLWSLSGFCPSVSVTGARLGRVCCLWSVSQCVCPVPLAFLVGHLRRQQKAPALELYTITLTSQVSVSAQWPHFCLHTFQASIGPGARPAGDGGTQPAVLLPFQNSPQQSCSQKPQNSWWEGTGLHAALLPCPEVISPGGAGCGGSRSQASLGKPVSLMFKRKQHSLWQPRAGTMRGLTWGSSTVLHLITLAVLGESESEKAQSSGHQVGQHTIGSCLARLTFFFLYSPG